MSIRAKRGTRAQVNAAAAATGLKAGEIIFITDEGVQAVALTTSTYVIVGGQGAEAKAYALNLHFGN